MMRWSRIALAVSLVAMAAGLGVAGDTPAAEDDSLSFAYSSGKCMRGRGLERRGDAAETFRVPESVLRWQFGDLLELEFMVWGNCCPDSERFVVASHLCGDTLAITVADTAASLCRCVCPYVISATCEDVPSDRYVVTGLLGKEHEIFPPTAVARGESGPPGEAAEEETSSERPD